MDQKERLIYLVTHLMKENAEGDSIAVEPLLPLSYTQLLHMYRGLINLRLPYEISEEFLQVQDDFLKAYHAGRDQVSFNEMTEVAPQIYLWQGDITQLAVDAIVNAANSEFLGCFIPNHHCIDNEIQTKGGYQIRLDCYDIRQEQGRKEPIGRAKITDAHNLPSNYIIHTVAPITNGKPSGIKDKMLADCYTSVLKLADENNLETVAFNCIGTGQFGFPQERGASIAIETVTNYLKETGSSINVIFDVFEDSDLEIYNNLLNANVR